MPFKLEIAGGSDVDELGEVLRAAFKNEHILKQLMPNTPVQAQNAFWAGFIRSDFGKPGEKVYKITESDSG